MKQNLQSSRTESVMLGSVTSYRRAAMTLLLAVITTMTSYLHRDQRHGWGQWPELWKPGGRQQEHKVVRRQS